MKHLRALVLLAAIAPISLTSEAAPPPRKTEVSIRGEDFWINGRPTYEGRTWEDSGSRACS